MLNVALLEPFWGGSHRAVAQGWAARSAHRIRTYTLPARFWKWRMRGAALDLARRLRADLDGTDVLFVSGLMDLAHLAALLPRRVPSVLYLHENQLAYPARPGEEPPERDLQFAFTNLASALAADRVAFNSAFQRGAFLAELERLLRRMPDARPLWAVDEIDRKSEVLHPGVLLEDVPEPSARGEGPPVILWNHRWEHDKDPEAFFRVLGALAGEGVPFRVAVAGESFGRVPAVFRQARERLAGRVVHWGYVPLRRSYVDLLARCHIVVSTARQENFGLSIVEAAYAGAHPLVPARLAYPEVLPDRFHGACLYRDEADLATRLKRLLTGAQRPVPPLELRREMARYGWSRRAPAFDDVVRQVSGSAGLCYK